MFVVFEGADNVGKTTQVKEVADLLRNVYDKDVITTRAPGGTHIAEAIRTFIHTLNVDVKDPVCTMLMLTAQLEQVNAIIKPSLTDGKIVLCDRYIYSTYVYQGFITIADEYTRIDADKTTNTCKLFDVFKAMVNALLAPNLVIYMKASADYLIKREIDLKTKGHVEIPEVWKQGADEIGALWERSINTPFKRSLVNDYDRLFHLPNLNHYIKEINHFGTTFRTINVEDKSIPDITKLITDCILDFK